MQVLAGGGGEGSLRAGAGGPRGGVECAVGEVPCHCVWGHPRAVLRSHRAVPNWRRGTRYELPFHGGLCRSVLFGPETVYLEKEAFLSFLVIELLMTDFMDQFETVFNFNFGISFVL